MIVRAGWLAALAAALALGTAPAQDKAVAGRALAPTLQADLGGGVSLDFVLIRPGTFQMGASDEPPIRQATVSAAFYLGKHEVTQAQWERVMGTNPAQFKGAQNPVDSVSWKDVRDFLVRLNARERATYRLPTEVEWEYACRAGTTTAYFWGDSFDGEYAWASTNSTGPVPAGAAKPVKGNGGQDEGSVRYNAPQPVGTRRPNPWGLYDLSGNLWEWCQDRVAIPDPDEGEQADLTTCRVLRGGSWNHPSLFCRSAQRFSYPPTERSCILGFRLVREVR